jgi:phosphoribosyl-AMP cyclohydrolase / phosphoribosyl-ATP pyrophosphohydrolase
MNMIDLSTIDFDKNGGLIPVVVQDSGTQKVLMMAYANQESLKQSLETGKLTFYSRSRKRIWVKGESSGHFLMLKELLSDCDGDTILAKVEPVGPVCHTGNDTCWNEKNGTNSFDFLEYLGDVIESRKLSTDTGSSYVSGLFNKGINKIAQKVGEEATELIIEAKDDDDELFLNEAADLLFHIMILLSAKGYSLKDVTAVLGHRQKPASKDTE